MPGPNERGGIPSIRLWDLLLVPLQGDISDEQVEKLSDQVLHQIHATDTAGLIVDVTGLWLMDSHLCSALTRLAASTRLMGSRTVLCGLSPEIAVTLQTMGLELDEVLTVPSLEEALMSLGIGPRGDREMTGRHEEDFDLDVIAGSLGDGEVSQ